MGDEKDKPILNEETLAKLLEAAYVVQQHNDRLKKLQSERQAVQDQLRARDSSPTPSEPQKPKKESAAGVDYAPTLAEIIETQHRIQSLHLSLNETMSLVAERVRKLTKAGGAAIGIRDANKIRYAAVSGSMTLPAGSEVDVQKALCTACLEKSQVVRSGDVNAEALVDAAECRRRGIRSMIAVPIYSDEAVAGALELYGAAVQAFAEQDVHTCQLMAGLVTEALAQDEDLDGKKSAANERAMMAESLEKLQPNLAALADTPEVKEVLAHLAGAMAAPPAPTFACRKCGHQLMGEEQFCGKCGTPRSSDYEPPTVQSKVASLWHMQEALRRKNAPPADSNADAPSFSSVAGIPGKPAAESNEEESIEAESIDKEMPDFSRAREWRSKRAIEARRSEFAEPKEREPEEKGDGLEDLERGEETAAGEAEAPAEEALVKHSHPWSSAASARDFFEQLAKTKERGGWAQIWSTRRGDFYLTIAVILVIAVIGWGILSSHAGPGAHNAAHKPGADLSLFDRMLISLGLAEAPPPPEYKGNPSTQVWVDLQTALYYCPGADLYGKTPKGKFTTQRAAQLDQFEPASRKACD